MTDRTTARVVGFLFILATATAIVGGLLVQPVEDPDALAAGDVGTAGVITGVVLELILVLSVIGIAAVILPVLERRNRGGAVAYLGFRITEGMLLLAGAVSGLLVSSRGRSCRTPPTPHSPPTSCVWHGSGPT